MTTEGMQLYEVIKARMGERKAEAVVNYMDNTLKENNREMREWSLKKLATKEDLANLKGELKEDLANLKGELKEDLANLKGELKGDLAILKGALKGDIANLEGEPKGDLANARMEIANVKGSLETKIAEVKSDVIRWTFAFFVTMMLAILGLYLKK